MNENENARNALFLELGVSQAKVAARAGVNPATLAKVLRGEDAHASKVRAVDRALVAYAEESGVEVPPTLADVPAAPADHLEADEPLIEFEVGGNFGVSVVVRGPISERAELEKAVLDLIQGMNSPKK